MPIQDTDADHMADWMYSRLQTFVVRICVVNLELFLNPWLCKLSSARLACDIHGPEPYKFIGFGDIHGPQTL